MEGESAMAQMEERIDKSIIYFNSNIHHLSRADLRETVDFDEEGFDKETFRKNVVSTYLMLDCAFRKCKTEVERVRDGWEREQNRNIFLLLIYCIFWHFNSLFLLLCLTLCYQLTPFFELSFLDASRPPTVHIQDSDSGIGSDDGEGSFIHTPLDRANAIANFLCTLIPHQPYKRSETPSTPFTTFQPRRRRLSTSLSATNSPIVPQSQLTFDTPSPLNMWRTPTRGHQSTASSPQTFISKRLSWNIPHRRSDSTPNVDENKQSPKSDFTLLLKRSMTIKEVFASDFQKVLLSLDRTLKAAVETEARLKAVIEVSDDDGSLGDEAQKKEEWQWKLEDLMKEENLTKSESLHSQPWSQNPKTILSLSIFAIGVLLTSVGIKTLSKIAFAVLGFWIFGKPLGGVWKEISTVLNPKPIFIRLIRSTFPTQVQLSFRTLRMAKNEGLSVFSIQGSDENCLPVPPAPSTPPQLKLQTNFEQDDHLRRRRKKTEVPSFMVRGKVETVATPSSSPSSFLSVVNPRHRTTSAPPPPTQSLCLEEGGPSDDEREQRLNDLLDEASQRLNSTTLSFYCQYNDIPGHLVLFLPHPTTRKIRESKATLSFIPGIASANLYLLSIPPTSKSLSHGRKRSSRNMLQSIEFDLDDILCLKKLDEGMGEEGLEVTVSSLGGLGSGETCHVFSTVQDRDYCFLRTAFGVERKWDVEG